jgi:hypothetical protein
MRIVQPAPHPVIPRIGHLIYWHKKGVWPLSDNSQSKFRFLSYLSVISALHVAGLHHVYVHGDVEPGGEWWEELRKENVTFVHTDPPSSVFQNPVNSLSHKSDLLRLD